MTASYFMEMMCGTNDDNIRDINSRISAATLSECVRLHACRAPWTNGWIPTTPSLTEDTFMPNIAFQDSVSMRFGMMVFQDDEGCPYCHQVNDRHGHHTISYMKVGTLTKVHHSLYNYLYRLAQEANLRPQLEASGLLPDAPQRRPADVLLPITNLLKQTSWRRYSSFCYCKGLCRAQTPGTGHCATIHNTIYWLPTYHL